MGRPKKDNSVCKISSRHTLEEKKEILDKYIFMRRLNDITQKEICDKLDITPQSLYSWIKEKELKSYDKKFRDATKIADYTSSEEVVIDAKKSLRKMICGYESVEKTQQFKYENGKKILVQEYIKTKNILPDFEQIKFVLERLSPVYSDNSTKNILNTFMSFNSYLQEISPELAQRISILQNNFLSQSVKEIEEIK